VTAERARAIFGRPVPAWDALAEADPEFAEAYTSCLEASWDTGVLEPRIRELYGAEEFPRPEQTQGRYWDDFEARVPGFNGMLAHALPGVFTAYRKLGRTMWRSGGLAPKWCELALVVADLSTTHLYRSGAALHIHAAIRHGATREEVAAAIALAVPTGARTLELGIAALTVHAEDSASGRPGG
jgi:alkylhydroperoxidase/carboxymuconolactone decarboxylase family protein YurZ